MIIGHAQVHVKSHPSSMAGQELLTVFNGDVAVLQWFTCWSRKEYTSVGMSLLICQDLVSSMNLRFVKALHSE